MKKIILFFLIIFMLTLLSCDKVGPGDTLLVQSPNDSTEGSSESDTASTDTPNNTSAPETSSPIVTDAPTEDTYNKDYSGRY